MVRQMKGLHYLQFGNDFMYGGPDWAERKISTSMPCGRVYVYKYYPRRYFTG